MAMGRNKFSLMPVAASALLLVAHSAHAQNTVYKCIDADGKSSYTNVQRDAQNRNCTVVSKEISVIQAPKPAAAAPGASSSSSAGFPKVDKDTQKARDDNRRKILEDELAAEEKNLATARAKLAEQENVRYGDEKNYQRVIDRLQPFKDAVESHEKNINALKKELANLK